MEMYKIRFIDHQIDTIHSRLRSMERISALSAASWQRAWDKHPDLQQEERRLFLIRAELRAAQLEKEERGHRKRQRAERAAYRRQPKTHCVACGQSLPAIAA